MKKSCTWAAMAASGLLTMVGVAGKASAQCTTYNVTQSSGAVIVPGTADIGQHGDDLNTTVNLPFSFNFYGTAFTAAKVGSNGHIEFSGAASTAYSNTCIAPNTVVGGLAGSTMYPHWDDMRTDGTGRGIFTATYGTSPNQSFVIEWRAGYFSGPTGTANFEVILYEGQTYFDFIYGTINDGAGTVQGEGASATVGVKADSAIGAPVTQFSCNTGSLTNGLQLRFDCPATTPPTGVGSANPASVPNNGVTPTLLSVLVTPGTGPASTAHTVTANLSNIGGSASQAFYDDGTNGDATPGDLRFSYLTTVPGSVTPGAQGIPFVVQETAPLSRSSNGSFSVTVIPPPPVNDDCAGAIPAVVGDNAFDSTSATTSTPAATCGLLGNDLWYTFSDPAGANVTITTCGLITADSAIAVYSDCTTVVACVDDACGLQTRVSFCAAAGQNYLIRVGGFNGVRWSGVFNLAADHTAPTPYATPSGAVVEPEPCGVNNPDTVDGGCNSTPPVYQTLQLCTNYTGTVASSTSFRDTDWYQFTVAATTTYALTGQAQFPVYAFVVAEPCPGAVTAGPFANAITGACFPNYNFGASVTLNPGTYDIVIVPQSFDGLTVCGSNENYWFSLTPDGGCAPDVCCRSDYDGDGDIGTDADIEAFFACLGGNCCATCPTDSDFNCDGDAGTDADIESFFSVLAGGAC